MAIYHFLKFQSKVVGIIGNSFLLYRFVNYVEARRDRTVQIHNEDIVQFYQSSRVTFINFGAVSVLVNLNRYLFKIFPKYLIIFNQKDTIRTSIQVCRVPLLLTLDSYLPTSHFHVFTHVHANTINYIFDIKYSWTKSMDVAQVSFLLG